MAFKCTNVCCSSEIYKQCQDCKSFSTLEDHDFGSFHRAICSKNRFLKIEAFCVCELANRLDARTPTVASQPAVSAPIKESSTPAVAKESSTPAVAKESIPDTVAAKESTTKQSTPDTVATKESSTPAVVNAPTKESTTKETPTVEEWIQLNHIFESSVLAWLARMYADLNEETKAKVQKKAKQYVQASELFTIPPLIKYEDEKLYPLIQQLEKRLAAFEGGGLNPNIPDLLIVGKCEGKNCNAHNYVPGEVIATQVGIANCAFIGWKQGLAIRTGLMFCFKKDHFRVATPQECLLWALAETYQ